MDVLILYPQTKDPRWLAEAQEEYLAKISRHVPVQVRLSKSPTAARDQAEFKKQKESTEILALLQPQDQVVLLHEEGRALSSMQFAQTFKGWIETSRRLVFVIGGPYGTTEEVFQRAHVRLRLSDLTLSHFTARLVLWEQLYRATTLVKGIPYHNE